MKIAIVSADTEGRIDGTLQAALLDHLPNVVKTIGEADVVIIPISYLTNYKFNEILETIGSKPTCLMDFCEFGWDAGDDDNVLGRGVTPEFGHLATAEYAKLERWIIDRKPALTFKRELLLRDLSPTMQPIAWPCITPPLPLQTKEQFDARPLEVFFCWGLSSPMRPRLHGAIFQNAHGYGYHVIDNFKDEGHFEKRTWATMHVPHYRRMHVNEVLRWNRRAKISVSLHGAGKVCFRSTMESPVGSIMALPYDDLAWAFDWKHGENCIRLRPDHLFEDLEMATRRDDLHAIYEQCQQTVDRYRSQRYILEYILPKIEAIL